MTKENTRNREMMIRKILVLALVCIAVIAAAGLISGCASLGPKQLVEDPEGRFSYEFTGNDFVQQQTDGSFFHYSMESPAMEMYVAAVEASSEEEGIAGALRISGADPAALSWNGTASFNEWVLKAYSRADSTRWTAIAYQYTGETMYALVLEGNSDSSPDPPPKTVIHMLRTFSAAGIADSSNRPDNRNDLEEYIANAANSSGGSISIAAVKNGEVVYRFAAGNRNMDTPADVNTAYNWGSITKIATATAVLQLVEEGLIELDSTIDEYFPEFSRGNEITVRNLLTHSSGLPDRDVDYYIGYEDIKVPGMKETLSEYWSFAAESVFQPGSASAYNNWNFLILGVLVERVSGMPFTRYTDENIYTPLGMRSTTHLYQELPSDVPAANSSFTPETMADLVAYMNDHGFYGEGMIVGRSSDHAYFTPVNILPPWGGVWSTVDEAARFGWMFLSDGTVSGSRILNKKSVEQMFRMQKSNTGKPLGIGLCWFIQDADGEKIIEHAGGGPGINALLRLYPERNMSVAIMGSMNDYPADLILGMTADILSGK